MFIHRVDLPRKSNLSAFKLLVTRSNPRSARYAAGVTLQSPGSCSAPWDREHARNVR